MRVPAELGRQLMAEDLAVPAFVRSTMLHVLDELWAPDPNRRSASAPALTLTGSTAFDIRIYNDTADEIVVTVYDMNAGSPRPVLARQVIDGFAWLTTSVTPSIGSDGHVRWIAQTIGTAFHKCGNGESGGLRTNAMVKVFTDSRCVKISPRP
jgi:hypothetical protein